MPLGVPESRYYDFRISSDMATSMLLMDAGDEYFGDNFEMLVTVFAVFVTNNLYLLTLPVVSDINNQKMSLISKFSH